MKKAAVMLLFLVICSGCNSQEKEKQEPRKEQKDTAVQQPKEKWDVKKEYDKYGNLVKYDSIYSYSYSNIEGDTIMVNLDSIMDSFRGYFEENSFVKTKDHFSYFPQMDSMFINDFFKDDYFNNLWNRQPLDISKKMQQMDSMRNDFMKKFYPGLMQSRNIPKN